MSIFNTWGRIGDESSNLLSVLNCIGYHSTKQIGDLFFEEGKEVFIESGSQFF